jgi:hypothetical protein
MVLDGNMAVLRSIFFQIISVMVVITLLTKSEDVEIVSNMNFGSFLVPKKTLVNSGSSWEHIFDLTDFITDPLDKWVYKPLAIDEYCQELARILIDKMNKCVKRSGVVGDKEFHPHMTIMDYDDVTVDTTKYIKREGHMCPLKT